MNALEILTKRGIVNTVSDPALGDLFAKEMVSFYCGYDPSFRSLQIGNLFAIVTMRRLQELGHRPVVLVGGATGCIGDPSGRSTERNLLEMDTVRSNVESIRKQLESLIDFGDKKNGAILVNNYDWLSKFNFLDFLRDVGRRFRVSDMMARESVKRRMESEDGVSYTEFSYQILQAYDYLHLYENHGVRLQMGGGDQWGNITAGIDLVRRVRAAQVFGMVVPLVTDSKGQKFGKSLGGTVYLDPEISSPYQMYQFLMNAEDVCVVDYLKYYTFLSLEEIDELAREVSERPEGRVAQRRLAGEVVKFVHGEKGLAQAEKATGIFFGDAIENVSDDDLQSIFAEVPRVELEKDKLAAGINIVDLLALTPIWKGKNDVRRSIEQRGAYLNNIPVEAADVTVTTANLASAGALVVRKGKKNYALVKVV
ncbi:MAG: tyrosine--tRNA ligase [Planctomycetaceae bacterium]|nr:tyrosine--tRNA ligase [Planctomycetaceae bacterium]